MSIPFPPPEPRFSIYRPGRSATASLAAIPNTAQVDLEAGNSPQMFCRHYWELVRPADAEKWFAVTPAGAEAAKTAREKGATGKIVKLPKEAAA